MTFQGAWVLAAFLTAGCTHHSVRLEALNDPDNRILVTEEVRSWPVMMTNQLIIRIPAGTYPYRPQDYDLQTNFPERPIRTLKSQEVEVLVKGAPVKEIDGGWIAIFRDGIEIQLLVRGQPSTFNGRYQTKVPFIRPSSD